MNAQMVLYLQSDGDSTAVVCCGGILLFIVAILVVVVKAGNDQAKQLNAAREEQARKLKAAKDAYFDALRRLKASPTSADLRQKTLRLGREYSNLTRNNEGTTIYDEVALSNDINAACAGAALVVNKQESFTTVEARLKNLVELKNLGLIDEEEYAATRKKILDEV